MQKCQSYLFCSSNKLVFYHVSIILKYNYRFATNGAQTVLIGISTQCLYTLLPTLWKTLKCLACIFTPLHIRMRKFVGVITHAVPAVYQPGSLVNQTVFCTFTHARACVYVEKRLRLARACRGVARISKGRGGFCPLRRNMYWQNFHLVLISTAWRL